MNGGAGHTEKKLRGILESALGGIVAHSVLITSIGRCGVDPGRLQPGDAGRLLEAIEAGTGIFLGDPGARRRIHDELTAALGIEAGRPPAAGDREVPIRTEEDIVIARNAGRDMAAAVGFQATDQVKISTVISELARNINKYTPGGSVRLRALDGNMPGIEIVAADRGPGIPHLQQVMNGEHKSKTGMGMGLLGTKRLMDHFEVQTSAGAGTTVTTRKYRP